MAHDEIYTKTGTNFDATDIPELKYNRDYSFIFTKGMDSSDLFEVRVDYRTQNVIDDNDSDCYNDKNIPVIGIDMCDDSCTINVGVSTCLYYNIYPCDASNRSVIWSSSDPSVVDGEEVMGYEIDGIFNGKFKDGKYTSTHPEGENLSYYLKNKGYKENVNLFVFNYPNEDAVIHSAKKFKKYIENLIDYVRTSGTQEEKCCFYRSTEDYNKNNFKINIVGHSMGGLIARYYIENLQHVISYNVGDSIYNVLMDCDKFVDKLITICTPHWGSGYGEFSGNTGIKHKLCDHDLDFDSSMFGGNNSDTISHNCTNNGQYMVSDELQYNKNRYTKYYAIAAVDYKVNEIDKNDECFEMPVEYTSFKQINDFFNLKGIYKTVIDLDNPLGNDLQVYDLIDVKNEGDNMVGLLSQIGWTEKGNNTPDKKIDIYKIFIDVDTDGDNGGETFVWEAINGFGTKLLHNKAPHRKKILEKVYEYLKE